MTPSLEIAAGVVAFWEAAGPERWFAKSDEFDARIRARYMPLVERAAAGELDDWAHEREGALALLLLLDQFPRNLYRGSARAFAADAHARRIADAAIEAGFDMAYDKPLRAFFYLPFMHSEALADQERCVKLTAERARESTRDYAVIHRDIIARFGRFPHRNAVLGRASTPEEIAFLADPASFKG